MKKWIKKFLGIPIITLPILISCIDEFEPQTQIESENVQLASALVVDGLLTDEMKQHRVILTRAFAFEDENPRPESNATVKIMDSNGREFPFQESEPGVYLSQIEFAAIQGETYTLEIETNTGTRYASENVDTPTRIAIDDLHAERIVNDLGKDGVGIFLDNNSDSSDPTFFRYEFEETYKIIAPNWDPFKLEVVRYEPCFPDPFVVDITPWEDERKTCFGSRTSQRLIQTSSAALENNLIDDFQVQFLDAENYIISHRYSILVTQYSQTQDAFSFYERLGDFSSSDNLFSQIQPGFLEGNISSNNDSEPVLGYFEVASVSKERMYFNYADLFSDEPLPPYAISCENFGNPRLIPRMYHCASEGVCDGNCQSPLIEAILADQVTFAAEKEDDFVSPYYTWPSPCGDCTKLGSNIVPEFWIEE